MLPRKALSTLGIAVVLALCCTPAQAKKPPAPGALATLSYPRGDPSAGYGPADLGDPYPGWNLCPGCGVPLDNTATTTPVVLGDSGDGGLLVARIVDQSKLRLDTYDPKTYRRVATRSTSFRSWGIGGMLLGSDANVYVLLGRGNYDESKTKVVIEVRKLSRKLSGEGVAEIAGGFDQQGIYGPFEATDSSMALVGDTLIVHTARTIFAIEDLHHQVNLSFAVDTSTMTPRAVDAPYASHSFRQFVRPYGLDAVFLDHGDAYPRAVQIGIVGGLFGPPPMVPDCPQTGDPTPPPPECEMGPPQPRSDIYKALTFPGRVGDNFTGATVDGFELGTNDALTLGLSVPNRHPVAGVRGSSGRYLRNAYVIATDLTTGASRFAWLTTYRPTTKRLSVGEPQLVPLGEDRFAALFTTAKRGRTTRRMTTQYRLLDQTGAVVARKSWPGRQFAAISQPVRVGNKLFWVGYWSGTHRPPYRQGDFLYGLDVRDPTHPRLLRR